MFYRKYSGAAFGKRLSRCRMELNGLYVCRRLFELSRCAQIVRAVDHILRLGLY